MFDKITIRAAVSGEECVHLAQLHRLHVWTNAEGGQTEYRSSEYAKITGVEVRIVRHVATVKASLHKYWMKRNFGGLRNDNLFTMSEARAAFEMLLWENGFVPSRVRVVQFEIGLNLVVSRDPLEFIERAEHIGGRNKLMFVDANFRINRQKTTEKHRDIRKYYKIYDKGWEMAEKKRTRDPSDFSPEEVLNILRIETVYRRHNERGDRFFTAENTERLAKRFYADWKGLFFRREVCADKGMRKSEVERARMVANMGAGGYMALVREELECGRMTQKQYRTIREWVRDYERDGEQGWRVVVSPQEMEYGGLMTRVFGEARR